MLPGVIVAADETNGWLVIDKPPNVPVHMTVDNRHENAVECLRLAGISETVYAPQRLDQNTSGLLMMGTSKVFTNYFASLLRTKTQHQLESGSDDSTGGVRKLYRW
jgi:23S rRNA-/tRNA-specific pseudouridylate synthase